MIEIRNAEISDADRLLEIYDHYVRKTAITFEYDTPSRNEFISRMEHTMKRYPYLVIEKDGRIEGYAYAGVFKDRDAYSRSCEMTIYIDHNAQKCGLGRMLYEALEDRLKKMGMLNLYACIGYPDEDDEYLTGNSVGFHEHLGYVKAGEFHKCGYKFGRWYNMTWMEKIIGEHTEERILSIEVETICAADDLQLHIPYPGDGWFYVRMMSDPATMAYNAPWFPPDGCIPEPESEWDYLQEKWIGKVPERFYAFLQRISDGTFVGDVNYHYNSEHDWFDMGIVIYAPERGKGYGRQGLELLLDHAFRVDGITRLHNEFETERDAAYHIHKAVGFKEIGRENGLIQLELTREEYITDN